MPLRGPSHLSIARTRATCRSTSCARCSCLTASNKTPTQGALAATRWLSDGGMNQERFVPLRGPRYFSFACPKEKYPRENDTPLGACRASLPGKSVRRGRAFRTSILPVRKGVDIPVDSPAGLSSPPHRRTGAPGRAAGHPGPHSVRHRYAAVRAEEQEVPLRAGLSKVANVSARPLSDSR